MIDSLYIAWRYVCFYRYKTAILVASITLMVYLPAGVDALVDDSAAQLRRRAQTTPLLIGAKGSETDLVLNSLYFESEAPATIKMSAVDRVRHSKLATAIPLHVQFQGRGRPIVGTSLDYFRFRKLEIERGRQFAMLGECVVGHDAAKTLGVSPGDGLLSSPENVFDLAGVYPLKMHVVGILHPTDSPDDAAIFVDIKTAWIIAGLGHGHQDLAQADAADSLLKREGNRLTANASVVTFTEITSDNVDSFHFHGELESFPITGVIAVPNDEKSRTLLMGRYQGDDELSQVVRPSDVMGKLLATILRVRTFVVAGALLLGIATSLAVVLVFMLSLRLRRNEIVTMTRIGGSRIRVVLIVAWEVLLVISLSGCIAAGLTFATRQFGETLIRWFLL